MTHPRHDTTTERRTDAERIGRLSRSEHALALPRDKP
jgi:hypothetical protein